MALSPPVDTGIATRQGVTHAQALTSAQLGEMRALMAADVARMEARVERMGSRTLRWTVGTIAPGAPPSSHCPR